jgi:mannonate dehydratase
MESQMRIAVGQFNDLTDEILAFTKQLGVGSVQMNLLGRSPLPGDRRWEYADLRALVERVEAAGLAFEAIENVPLPFYDKVLLGLPGRDEQIEHYCQTIRNMGRAGIPILGYHFSPSSVWRTEPVAGRGGAIVTAFDLAVVEAAPYAAQRAYAVVQSPAVDAQFAQQIMVDEDAMWANYAYFVRAVLPVAEEAGVRLALHPDDPPVPVLGGIARIFKNVADFKRGYELANGSPAWGLDLCLGCCSEMPGGAANVREMIEFFGPKGRIFYVHFRDVQGTVPKFAECFIGEGNYDPAEVMLLLKRNGFTGFLLDDHVPQMVNDSPYGHRGRAHAIGYMQGLLDIIAALA